MHSVHFQCWYLDSLCLIDRPKCFTTAPSWESHLDESSVHSLFSSFKRFIIPNMLCKREWVGHVKAPYVQQNGGSRAIRVNDFHTHPLWVMIYEIAVKLAWIIHERIHIIIQYKVVQNVLYDVSIRHSHLRQPLTFCSVRRLNVYAQLVLKLDIARFDHVIWMSDRWPPCILPRWTCYAPPSYMNLVSIWRSHWGKRVLYETTLVRKDGSTIGSLE